MSKSQYTLVEDRRAEQQARQRQLLILEKQLIDTFELKWFVQRVQIGSREATTTKALSLFEGMTSELQTFIDSIKRRLELSVNVDPPMIEVVPSSYWRLFAEDVVAPHEQFEALLCGYACYAGQTSEAIASLRHFGDRESSELLRVILKTVRRCLRFLEIYLEGLAETRR